MAFGGGARLLSMVALEAEPILCGVPSPLTYSVLRGHWPQFGLLYDLAGMSR